jgi:F-type H+-transporting ATPase subunit epsilon
MARIRLDIVTPERKILSVEVDEVRAPGAEGQFGVRPGHTPFISAVDPGELCYVTGGETYRYAVGGGFVEVAGDRVIVLADTAESESEIDLERAREAEVDAKAKLARMAETDPKYRLEAARVRRATARVKVARR